MRYLNKIVFINSADIKYAPIKLNGNVHLIGNQGAGKSTILRAVLFFYNANTQKLGIPTGPTNESFADFYFPYINSRIIYEIQADSGPFCVMALKVRNRVSFRFLDMKYREDIFMDEGGNVYSTWDQIRKILDKNNISYTPKISNYKKYRDIIYGNNEIARKFSRYYILKSRNYKNIPRTIQNVFLNSKLEAEFIKQTIIMSMNEEDFAINLNNYIHHLQDFEKDLNDIEIMEKDYTRKLIKKIENNFGTINYLNKEIIKRSRGLQFSVDLAEKNLPAITNKLKNKKQARKAKKTEIEKAQQKYDDKIQQIAGQISVCKDKIRTARDKQEHYERLDIESIIKRVNKKSELVKEKENYQDEKDLLESKFQEITQKYKALKKELENRKNEFINAKNSEKNEKENQNIQARAKVKKQYEKIYQDIRKQHVEKLDDKQSSLELQKDKVYKLQNRLTEIKHKRFFEENIDNAKAKIQEINNEIQEKSNRLDRLKNEKSTNRTRAELEKDALKESSENRKEKLQEQIKISQNNINEIDGKISKSKDALYGWLNNNKQDWAEDIGKVCDEDILFRDDLSPKIIDKGAENLFNVDIDLDNLDSKFKTIQDYKIDKQHLKEDIVAIQEKIKAENKKLFDDLEKVKSKYNRKIKAIGKQVNVLKIEIEQNKKKLKSIKVDLSKYQKKAKAEKQNLIQQISAKIEKAQDEKNRLQQEFEELKDKVDGKIRYRERLEREELNKLEEELKASLQNIDDNIKNKVQEIEGEINNLDVRKKSALKDKGADTERIEVIDRKLLKIDNELNYIEENNRIVVEYRKDKKELFDKLPDLLNRKNLLTNKLQEIKENFSINRNKLKEELSNINAKINRIERERSQLEKNLEKFDKFKKSEIYEYIEDYLKYKTDYEEDLENIAEIIDKIKDTYFKKDRRVKDLEKDISRFTGEFAEDNIFKFQTIFPEDEDYLNFADELIDFMKEQKIDVYKKRVNERFADIIKTIGKELTTILSHKTEIRKVISKINKDFMKKNFVGAVKKIELKMDDSNNEIFSILYEIKEFNDQNMYSYGEPTIFADQDREEQNQKAIGLLKQLVKKLHSNKYDQISLSDSFDLMFRIEENQNDTGWVEKISNVGSDGTDVLVKAMVNIMLLNVFKDSAARKDGAFKLHCVMDEIGKLHPENVRGILRFANERNISLINGSPTEHNAMDYRHIYKIQKDEENISRAVRILSRI